jgi:hypothetical protein
MSETVPEEIFPVETVPEEIFPVETIPEEIVHVETVPEEIVHVETQPQETVNVPDVITLEDIQNEQTVLLQNETNFKDFLTQNILNVSLATIRPRLIHWARLNYPYGYTIISVPFSVPQSCSDGVHRSLREYIEFCLGTSIDDMITALSQKITGVILSVRVSQSLFEIIVIKA